MPIHSSPMRFLKTLAIFAIIALVSTQVHAQKSCAASKNRKTCGGSSVRKAPAGPQYVTIQVSSNEDDGRNNTVTKKIQVDHIPVQHRKQYIDRIVDEMAFEELDSNEGFTFKNTSKRIKTQNTQRPVAYSRR